MKNQKKVPISAERNARKAVLRKRFFRAGWLFIAGIFLYFYSYTLDIGLVDVLACTTPGWIVWYSIPIVLILLATACFSAYWFYSWFYDGDKDTRQADAVINIMIIIAGGWLAFVWYAIAFVN